MKNSEFPNILVPRVLDEKMGACNVLNIFLNVKKMKGGGYSDWENGGIMVIYKGCLVLIGKSVGIN